jgi:hypothetical protein
MELCQLVWAVLLVVAIGPAAAHGSKRPSVFADAIAALEAGGPSAGGTTRNHTLSVLEARKAAMLGLMVGDSAAAVREANRMADACLHLLPADDSRAAYCDDLVETSWTGLVDLQMLCETVMRNETSPNGTRPNVVTHQPLGDGASGFTRRCEIALTPVGRNAAHEKFGSAFELNLPPNHYLAHGFAMSPRPFLRNIPVRAWLLGTRAVVESQPPAAADLQAAAAARPSAVERRLRRLGRANLPAGVGAAADSFFAHLLQRHLDATPTAAPTPAGCCQLGSAGCCAWPAHADCGCDIHDPSSICYDASRAELSWTDAQGLQCAAWQSLECDRAAETGLYSGAEQVALLANCPVSCGNCSTVTSLGAGGDDAAATAAVNATAPPRPREMPRCLTDAARPYVGWECGGRCLGDAGSFNTCSKVQRLFNDPLCTCPVSLGVSADLSPDGCDVHDLGNLDSSCGGENVYPGYTDDVRVAGHLAAVPRVLQTSASAHAVDITFDLRLSSTQGRVAVTQATFVVHDGSGCGSSGSIGTATAVSWGAAVGIDGRASGTANTTAATATALVGKPLVVRTGGGDGVAVGCVVIKKAAEGLGECFLWTRPGTEDRQIYPDVPATHSTRGSFLIIRGDTFELPMEAGNEAAHKASFAGSREYWADTSAGRFQLGNNDVTVTPVLRMEGYTAAQIKNKFQLGNIVRDARRAAFAAGYDACRYTHNMFISPGYSGGVAYQGVWGASMYGIASWAIQSHEFGHVLGMHHASAWQPDVLGLLGNVTKGTDANSSAIGRGWAQEYGSAFDIMGGSFSMASQSNVAYKSRVGNWIEDTEKDQLADAWEQGMYLLHPHDERLSRNLERPKRVAMKIVAAEPHGLESFFKVSRPHSLTHSLTLHSPTHSLTLHSLILHSPILRRASSR